MTTVSERDREMARELLCDLDTEHNFAPGSLDDEPALRAIAAALAQARAEERERTPSGTAGGSDRQ